MKLNNVFEVLMDTRSTTLMISLLITILCSFFGTILVIVTWPMILIPMLLVLAVCRIGYALLKGK